MLIAIGAIAYVLILVVIFCCLVVASWGDED